MDTSKVNNDPYTALTQSIKRLTEPLDELLTTHDKFLLQNVTILNNVSSIPKFNESLKKGLEVQTNQEKLQNNTS